MLVSMGLMGLLLIPDELLRLLVSVVWCGQILGLVLIRQQIGTLASFKGSTKIYSQTTVLPSDRSLLGMINALSLCVSYVDAHLIYRFANKTYEDWFNKPLDLVVGQPLKTVIGESSYGIALPLIQRVLAGDRVTYETEYPYPSGIRYVAGTLIPDRDETGAVVGYYAVIEDVSDRRRAEFSLRQSEQKFSAAFHSNPDPLVISTVDTGEFLDVNNSFYQATGYLPGDVVGRTSTELNLWVNAKDRVIMMQCLRQSGRLQNYEVVFRGRSGAYHTGLVSCQLIHLNDQSCVLAVIKDITDRKRIELALQRSESELRALFQAMPDLVIVLDRSGLYVQIPPVNSHLLYAAMGDLLGKSLHDVLPLDQADTFLAWIHLCLDRQIVLQREYPLMIQGKQIWFQAQIAPMDHNQVIWVARNVTDLKQAEANLRQSQEQLKKITHGLPSAVYESIIVDQAQHFIFMSQGIHPLYGLEPGAVLANAQVLDACMLPGYGDDYRASLIQAQKTAQRWCYEYEIRTPQGQHKWIRGEAVPDWEAATEQLHWYGLLTDISDRKNYETQLEQQRQREKSLSMVIQAVRQSLDLQTVFATIVKEVGLILEAQEVGLYEYQETAQVWCNVWQGREQCCTPDQARHIQQYAQSLNLETPPHSPWMERLSQIPHADNRVTQRLMLGEVICLLDTRQVSDPIMAPIVKAYPGCWLLVPLTVEDQVWGCIIIVWSEFKVICASQDLEVVQELANPLAIAIQQSHLYTQIQTANQQLHYLANYDALTHVANRRYFDDYLETIWVDALARGEMVTIVLCDVDYFKAYNDTYGHPAGDHCLLTVAQVLKQAAQRSSDLVARYGGEEFIMVLPQTFYGGAIHVVRRAQALLKVKKISHSASCVAPDVTLSFGIACHSPQGNDRPQQLINQADTYLYRAKAAGRNGYSAGLLRRTSELS